MQLLRKRASTYEVDMCNGPILPNLLRVALPLVLTGMLQYMFNATNMVVVGNYASDNSMAAVGSTSSIVNLMTNLFLGLSIGANIVAARDYGARDTEALEQTVHTSILLSLFSGVFLTVVGILLAPQILEWMACPPAVLDLASLYLRVYFLGMPSMMVYNFGSALLRAQGDTRRPMYYLMLAGVLNVGLNLLCVVVLEWDVAGVAAATALSQTVSAALVLLCLIRNPGPIHLDVRKLRLDRYKLYQVLRIGLPAGIQSSLFSLSNVVIQSSVNSFGEVMMAGNSAATSLTNFIYATYHAFDQTNTAFISQNHGAHNVDRIWKIFLRSCGSAIVSTSVLIAIFLNFGPQLLGLFSPTPEVIAAGMIKISCCCIFEVLDAMMDMMAGSMRGIGYNVLPTVVTLIGCCALRLVWLSTIFQIPRFHTIEMVYISYPISWTLTLSTHIICFFWAYRKLRKKTLAEQPAISE